jgi:hypothetical protein
VYRSARIVDSALPDLCATLIIEADSSREKAGVVDNDEGEVTSCA